MLVLLYGLAHNTYPTLKPRLTEHPHTHRRTVFFFLDVAIRNSLRSNKEPGTVVIVDTEYIVIVSPYAVDVLIRAYFMESHPVAIYTNARVSYSSI